MSRSARSVRWRAVAAGLGAVAAVCAAAGGAAPAQARAVAGGGPGAATAAINCDIAMCGSNHNQVLL